jgi:hypothetical protein
MAGHLVWDQPPGTQIATSMCLSERVGLLPSVRFREDRSMKRENQNSGTGRCEQLTLRSRAIYDWRSTAPLPIEAAEKLDWREIAALSG